MTGSRKVKIVSIEPHNLVTCTSSATPNLIGFTIEYGNIVMVCTKAPDIEVSGFEIQTTMGATNAIVLHKLAAGSGPAPSIQTAQWQSNFLPPPERPFCSCVSGYFNQSGQYTSLTNHCNTTVIVKGMLDPDKNHPPPVAPFAPYSDRKFAQMTLVPNQEGRVPSPSADSGILIGISACPDPTPVAKNSCFVPKAVFQRMGKPWERTWCDQSKQVPDNGDVGKPCTCPLEGVNYPGCFADFPNHQFLECPH